MVHLDGWTKGYLFVNDFNLGRYWEVVHKEPLFTTPVINKNELFELLGKINLEFGINILTHHFRS
ncbi:hypothetical protein [Mesobacillus foraminis]|uniref:hypothetical protein n=1 Tax=Mesobacillus foraminis TaxID=279826 RepID=UPI00359C9B5F